MHMHSEAYLHELAGLGIQKDRLKDQVRASACELYSSLEMKSGYRVSMHFPYLENHILKLLYSTINTMSGPTKTVSVMATGFPREYPSERDIERILSGINKVSMYEDNWLKILLIAADTDGALH